MALSDILDSYDYRSEQELPCRYVSRRPENLFSMPLSQNFTFPTRSESHEDCSPDDQGAGSRDFYDGSGSREDQSNLDLEDLSLRGPMYGSESDVSILDGALWSPASSPKVCSQSWATSVLNGTDTFWNARETATVKLSPGMSGRASSSCVKWEPSSSCLPSKKRSWMRQRQNSLYSLKPST